MTNGLYYSVCAPALFGKLPLGEAVRKIAACGAEAYEFWGWKPADIEDAYRAQNDCGIRASALCTTHFLLNVPEKRTEYIEGVKNSIKAAKRLGARMLISQVGAERKDVSRKEQHESIAQGLKACAPLLEDADVILAIEPLNILVNHPGYYLTSSREAFDLIDEAGSPSVKVLFDIYHQQITEGNILESLLANAEKIAHLHIAGNPGRREPYENSELDYAYIIKRLAQSGRQGAIGLEYFPTGDPAESLKRFFEVMPKL